MVENCKEGIFPIGGTENANRILDVIFVHGLGGDAYSTWIYDDNDDSFWPKWLSEDFPDIGVWTIGYGATPSRWVDDVMPMEDRGLNLLNLLSIKNIGDRPLLFIAHSLGGLISKHILNQGKNHSQNEYKRIVDNVVGLIFIAVPHAGSGWADVLDAIKLVFRGNPVIDGLKKDEPALRCLSNGFTELVKEKSLKCACFFETKEVRYKKYRWSRSKGIKIVSESSARGDFPQDTPIGLADHHISICKLESRDTQLYGNTQKFIQSRIRELSFREAKTGDSNTEEKAKPPPAHKFQISGLPHTGGKMFGRLLELEMLDAAWNNGTNVLILNAMGGTGKTTLLQTWLDQLIADKYRGAQAVFTYSFYTQGNAENRQASSDEFFSLALTHFGYNGDLPSPYERGLKLAQLINEQRSLLILDGLESLQYPVGNLGGKLNDLSITVLLKQLAAQNEGLCLVSSRQTVAELKAKPPILVIHHDLEQLQKEDAVELLKWIGIKGSDAELEKAGEEVANHALALNLLGNYVRTVLAGDIRQRDKIPGLLADRKDGKHAENILAAYERHLQGTTELQVLYLLGLFDRPVSIDAIDFLRDANIPQLTDKFISNEEWRYALENLREQKLLNASNKDGEDRLDCHPLVREYFTWQLNVKYPIAWQQAHIKLYGYYKALPEKIYGTNLPETLNEMQPLFRAVAHGCLAGMHTLTWEEIYWPRIVRKNNKYLINSLGGFSDDIACLVSYFTSPWIIPDKRLNERRQALILNMVGFDLIAMNRTNEAIEPIKEAIKRYHDLKEWQEVARNLYNLSELLLRMGDFEQAMSTIKKSIYYADRSGQWESSKISRAINAYILHQAGKSEEALNLFFDAENIQKCRQPEFPLLYSLHGFYYCDLLLDRGMTNEVISRANYALKIATENNLGTLYVAVEKITLGRAMLVLGNISRALYWLDQAIFELRASRYSHDLAYGLLWCAALFRENRDFVLARQHLQEVFEIASYGPMRLYQADYHLESARLGLVQGLSEDAITHTISAENLIKEIGYNRRLPELAELKQSLNLA